MQSATLDDHKRLKLAFELFYCREPNDTELTESMRFLDEQSLLYSARPDARDQAWRDLCQSLMASSEFLYVE